MVAQADRRAGRARAASIAHDGGANRDPVARSQAIRTMQLQEQFLRKLQTSSRGAPGTLSPVAPTWSPLGPAPIPNGQTTAVEVAVSGRVTAIAVDPANANLVYVGTAQGGVYRSSDGGSTWMPLMDSALSLAIGFNSWRRLATKGVTWKGRVYQSG